MTTPMRAPSLDLLRALRSVNSSSINQQTCQHTRRRLISRTHLPKSSLPCSTRTFTTSLTSHNAAPVRNPYAPRNHDRGPKSDEDTQTDFGAMDVLGHIPAPATSVDACTTDGFHLDNGVKTEGGHAIILAGGEAFTWQPWLSSSSSPSPSTSKLSDLLDARKGALTFPKGSLGILEMLHPKPDLLIVGTGGKLWMLSMETRKYITEVLGCRLDVVDTANAAASYNLLAKERGVEGGAGVGALLLPLGWVGPKVGGTKKR